MSCLLIRKDGFITTNIAIPANQQEYRVAELRSFPAADWKPGAGLADRVAAETYERCFRLAAVAPRGVRIFEEE